ncbi:hypothetical protein [Limosilactobacillus equigenerosi]|nr:hypothetical protein [Limosilactobacillus equigenerosi]
MINLADEVNSYLDGDDFDYRQQTVDMIYGYQDEVKEVFNQEKNAVTDQYEEQLSKLNREIETVEETRIDDDKQ